MSVGEGRRRGHVVGQLVDRDAERQPRVRGAAPLGGPPHELVQHEASPEVLEHEDVLGPLTSDAATTSHADHPPKDRAERPRELSQRLVQRDVGVGTEASSHHRRVPFVGHVAEPVDGGVHGSRVHAPRRRGQLVLVVAPVAEVAEEGGHLRFERGAMGPLRALPRDQHRRPRRGRGRRRPAGRAPRAGERVGPSRRHRCRRRFDWRGPERTRTAPAADRAGSVGRPPGCSTRAAASCWRRCAAGRC